LDKLNLPESIDSIGIAESSQVEVRGLCHTCASKRGNSKRKTA